MIYIGENTVMSNTLIASLGDLTVNIQIKRPKFAPLWEAYKEVNKPATEVYKLIGGNVYALHLEDLKKAPEEQNYQNACALRMSRAFNYGGFRIPSGIIIQGTPIYRGKGADKLPYIFQVKGMVNFLNHNFGKPELSIKTNGQNIRDKFVGKQGIMLFLVSGWGDADGHVVLWNGEECSDGHCYFVHEQKGVETTKILLWELK